MRAIAISLFLAAPALVSAATASLRKRISGSATFYYTQTGNAGSCGSYLSDNDFTVAMNQVQYTDSMCGQTITINANGKTAQATIMDLCPTGGGNCNYGDMDMSPGLFQYFSSLDAGKIPIEWDFGGAPPPKPEPKPTTTQDQDTYTPPPPPPDTTTTYQPPPDTTTTTQDQGDQEDQEDQWTNWQPQTTTSTSSWSSSSSTSTSTSTSSHSSSSSSSAPATSPSPKLTVQNQDQSPMHGNLFGMNEAVVNIGSMLRYAGGKVA